MFKDEFWKNRSVLVTGGAGFIGSWLAEELARLGARVAVLDVKDELPQLGGEEDNVLRCASFICGDVRDEALLDSLFEKHRFKTVFHLAARAIVDEALKDPKECLDTNVSGTWKVLEAARLYLPEDGEVVAASSDKAYGAHDKLPYREEFELRGSGHPYDASKAAADEIVRMYANVYAVPACVVRCGNVYGGGDTNSSRLIPDAIRSFFADEPINIRSDGTFVRDYVYVKDVVDAYLAVAEALREKKLRGEAFNFGNNAPATPLDVVHAIQKIMKKERLEPKILNAAKYEIKEQYLDAAKANRILGWKPHYTLEGGLKETVEWYNAHLNA